MCNKLAAVETPRQTDPYGCRNPLPVVPVKDQVTVPWTAQADCFASPPVAGRQELLWKEQAGAPASNTEISHRGAAA